MWTVLPRNQVSALVAAGLLRIDKQYPFLRDRQGRIRSIIHVVGKHGARPTLPDWLVGQAGPAPSSVDLWLTWRSGLLAAAAFDHLADELGRVNQQVEQANSKTSEVWRALYHSELRTGLEMLQDYEEFPEQCGELTVREALFRVRSGRDRLALLLEDRTGAGDWEWIVPAFAIVCLAQARAHCLIGQPGPAEKRVREGAVAANRWFDRSAKAVLNYLLILHERGAGLDELAALARTTPEDLPGAVATATGAPLTRITRYIEMKRSGSFDPHLYLEVFFPNTNVNPFSQAARPYLESTSLDPRAAQGQQVLEKAREARELYDRMNQHAEIARLGIEAAGTPLFLDLAKLRALRDLGEELIFVGDSELERM